MQPKISHFATVLVGAVAALASASSMACSLSPADPIRIKQLMANEIAHRLGISAQQIPLTAITQPQLITPFALGADCSGLASYHHTAGFRVSQPGGQGPRPAPWPGQEAQRQCVYEGVAVVLGYDYSSPVSVNFERKCH